MFVCQVVIFVFCTQLVKSFQLYKFQFSSYANQVVTFIDFGASILIVLLDVTGLVCQVVAGKLLFTDTGLSGILTIQGFFCLKAWSILAFL